MNDSGSSVRSDDEPTFATIDVDKAARPLAALLRSYETDVITTYDSNGGYGHQDHKQVHRVGARAARLAGIDVLYEATMNRDAVTRVRARLQVIDVLLPKRVPTAAAMQRWFADPAQITHRVDVSDYLDRKRAAMRAHRSQLLTSRGVPCSLGIYAALPRPLFRHIFGAEWYIRRGGVVQPWESTIFGDRIAASRP